MKSFSLLAPRIVFGRGVVSSLPKEVARYGSHVLLVRGRSVPFVDVIDAGLRALGCSVTTIICSGEPDLPQLEVALTTARATQVDCVLAMGGGAAIDLGKALAALIPAGRGPMAYLEVVGEGLPLDAAPLPFIACPTTAGTGAEATKNAVIAVPSHNRKVSLRDDRMFADLALVDPALTDKCPRGVTLASGLDAITQVIEPYLSARATPLIDALCRDSIPRGLQALARLMQGEDSSARDDLAYTSLMGGIALSNAGLGAVHGFAGVIGGRYSTPHGAICGRLLGPVLRMNERVLPEQGEKIARYQEVRHWLAEAFGGEPDSAFRLLEDWVDDKGLPHLSELIAPDADLTDIATESRTSSSMKANPVTLETHQLVQILWETLHR
ncbi:iron-containing alcohol dehydrogenase [Puniceibacterium sediminis]|uniref:Uncharacterized protein n=1 Tax=Puniceibacterium sediminis TaxID=1608407 RepID=A0A238VTD6_9RHOB|nr:iron-containing alcohol dehydrogenase [Puniceibacterium sediminis]SNR37417.1 hypothetical protein SAMN06265370_103122 [Puniceibacterium sediminis]